jgi:hypothetical protein
MSTLHSVDLSLNTTFIDYLKSINERGNIFPVDHESGIRNTALNYIKKRGDSEDFLYLIGVAGLENFFENPQGKMTILLPTNIKVNKNCIDKADARKIVLSCVLPEAFITQDDFIWGVYDTCMVSNRVYIAGDNVNYHYKIIEYDNITDNAVVHVVNGPFML